MSSSSSASLSNKKKTSKAVILTPKQAREGELKIIARRIRLWLDSRVHREEKKTVKKSTHKKRLRDEEEEEEDEEEEEEDVHTVTVVLAGFAGSRNGCTAWSEFWKALEVNLEQDGFKPASKYMSHVPEWTADEVAAGFPFVLSIMIYPPGVEGKYIPEGFVYDACQLPLDVFRRDYPEMPQGVSPKGAKESMYAVIASSPSSSPTAVCHFLGPGTAIGTCDQDKLLHALFGVDNSGDVYHGPGLLRMGIYYDDETTMSWGTKSPWASPGFKSPPWAVSDPDGETSSTDRRILARGFELFDVSSDPKPKPEVEAASAAAAASTNKRSKQ